MFSHTREHSSVVGIDWQNPDTCVPWRSSLNGRTRIQPSFPRALHLIVTMCCQHDSVLNQPRLRKQTSSNTPARILQQDMSNRKKNISVTSTLLSLIQFSRLLNNYILFSVHKVEGFQWQPPLSWIKAPKLYVRLDHGDPPSSFRTKETDFNISNWTDANQFIL